MDRASFVRFLRGKEDLKNTDLMAIIGDLWTLFRVAPSLYSQIVLLGCVDIKKTESNLHKTCEGRQAMLLKPFSKGPFFKGKHSCLRVFQLLRY